MLRLLFVCQCQAMHNEVQVRAMQKDIWRRCDQKNVGGFLLRSDRSLIGLFEGAEKTVIGQVEQLIRKHKVSSVQVICEEPVNVRVWDAWYSQFEVLGDVPQADVQKLEALAQNVMDAVEADQSKH